MAGEHELSLAVVGIGFPNADGSNRQSEALFCQPGEAVELRPEPKNEHDEYAVAVFSARGVQLGYLTAERAPWIGAKLKAGEEYSAIFQEAQPTATIIRARFGGGTPTLPGSGAPPIERPRREPRRQDDFYPDPEPGMWGA